MYEKQKKEQQTCNHVILHMMLLETIRKGDSIWWNGGLTE